jgi:hypothetical protein
MGALPKHVVLALCPPGGGGQMSLVLQQLYQHWDPLSLPINVGMNSPAGNLLGWWQDHKILPSSWLTTNRMSCPVGTFLS